MLNRKKSNLTQLETALTLGPDDGAKFPGRKSLIMCPIDIGGIGIGRKLSARWVEAELTVEKNGSGKSKSEHFACKRLLAKYVKEGQNQKVLEVFKDLQRNGTKPDSDTFVAAVNACANLKAIQDGKHIHAQVIQSEFESDVVVGTSLVHMYAKFGNLEDAKGVFNMSKRPVAGWNAMISGLAKSRQWEKSLDLFRQMHAERVRPNPFTYVRLLTACASASKLTIAGDSLPNPLTARASSNLI